MAQFRKPAHAAGNHDRYLILNKESDKISKDYFRTVVNRNYKDKYVQLAAERYRFNI